MKTVLKILTALAAVIGAAYVIATYGDKIVEWAKKLLNSCPCCTIESDFEDDAVEEAPAEEAVEEPAVEEVPADEEVEEIVIEENEPVAEETDFAE